MTPTLWAGADPFDYSPQPPSSAAPGARRTSPEALDEKPANWVDLDGAVRSIGAHALKANLARARDLQQALELATAGELVDGSRGRAIEAAHQLVGSAGTFGYAGASDRAAELERFFVRAVFDEANLTAAATQLSDLFAELATEPEY
jgi:HPt (histidine-containing phosphotransfer) domain-containing protein